MERHHSRFNILSADEITCVIKNKLTRIGIGMEEWHFERVRILFNGARNEAADNRARRYKRGVHARSKMRARADDRADVPHVEFPNSEIAFPSNDIHRIKWIPYGRKLFTKFYPYFPFTVIVELGRWFGSDEYRRIV